MRTLSFLLAPYALLAACSGGEPEYNAHDIEGVMPDLAFNLTDENGNAVEADDYDGRLKLLFFGYTNCPDICPATMARIRAALGGLDEATRENIDVLFVSVDPERDDPERLAQFTSSFGPRFVGLTGSQEQLKALNALVMGAKADWASFGSDVAKDVLRIARKGLKNRQRIRAGNQLDETQYIKPLDSIVASGKTFAEDLLDAYHTRWSDISEIYQECRY